MDQQLLVDQIKNLYNQIERITNERDELQSKLDRVSNVINQRQSQTDADLVKEIYGIVSDMNLSRRIVECLKDDDLHTINGFVGTSYLSQEQKNKVMLYSHKYRVSNGSQGRNANEKVKYSQKKVFELTRKLMNESKTYGLVID